MEIEDKILLAKLMDKIRICKTKNKIVNTEFLSVYEKNIVQQQLNKLKIENHFFFGGYGEAEGKVLILYPQKLELDIVKNELSSIIKVLKINIPKEVYNKYTHRDYLGAVMQAGLNRSRIGDIIVHEDCAYIIALAENIEYIKEYLKGLSKFNKANIEIINYTKIKAKPPEFSTHNITASSMRLDNIVAEIVRTSRSKAVNLLNEEKVFVNSKLETKNTKIIKENDVLAIRGKGKYIIHKILINNKTDKIIIEIKQYC